MPIARNRKQRVTQIAGWLAYHFPCKQNITIQWVKQIPNDYNDRGDYGYVEPPSTIVLSERACRDRYLAVETLLHEWAHLLRGRSHGWGHDEEFWQIYGHLYRAFYDGGGAEASEDY